MAICIIAKRARCGNKIVYILQKHDCKGPDTMRGIGNRELTIRN